MSPAEILTAIFSGLQVWTIVAGVLIGNLLTHATLYLLRGVRWRMR